MTFPHFADKKILVPPLLFSLDGPFFYLSSFLYNNIIKNKSTLKKKKKKVEGRNRFSSENVIICRSDVFTTSPLILLVICALVSK